MKNRNPFSNDPITQEEVRELRDRLISFWEDTMLVTEPNGYRIIALGNLKAMCDALIEAMNEQEQR